MLELSVPGHFYGFDTGIYLISAIIGFAISYYAYRAYKLTDSDTHKYLFSAFSILSAGLLTMCITSAYSYALWFTTGEMSIFSPLFGIDDIGMWVHFLASFIAYAMLIMMYAPKKYRDKLLILLPIASNNFIYFNVILFFMISYVAFRSIANYLTTRKRNAMLVMVSFVLIALYHLFLMFMPFYRGFYAFAHISLIVGFLSLLYMLIKVE